MTQGWQALFGAGPVVVDGGLSTQLSAQGQVASGRLWTGHVLLDNPAAIRAAHAAYVHAGADVIITSSYQVSRRGFVEDGLSELEADEALRASTRVAREAVAGSRVLVAASVGPYGAVLHDRSEYRGRYGLPPAELAAFHRERIDVLAATNPDLFAVETIPDVDEAVALVEVLADHPEVPAWMTFSAADGERVCAGQRIEDAVAVAASAPSIVGVGVNCTDPRFVADLTARIRETSALPIVVYPNGDGAFSDDLVRAWIAAGATAIGGCCGTDATAISALARVVASSAG